MPSRSKAIIFDLHDTLVHLVPTTEQAMAAALGVPAGTYAAAWGVIDDRIERGAWTPTSDDRWVDLYGELVVGLKLAFGAEEVAARFASLFQSVDSYTAFDDVPAALTQLVERGYRLGVLSNSDFALEPILTACGIGDLIEVAIPAVMYGTTKPRAEAFQLSCDALQLEPSECWFVGDRLIDDVTASAAVGMRAILVDRSGRYEDQQLSFPRVSDLAGLHKVVGTRRRE
jgi:putative hydrolase of the HAD superfamily